MNQPKSNNPSQIAVRVSRYTTDQYGGMNDILQSENFTSLPQAKQIQRISDYMLKHMSPQAIGMLITAIKRIVHFTTSSRTLSTDDLKDMRILQLDLYPRFSRKKIIYATLKMEIEEYYRKLPAEKRRMLGVEDMTMDEFVRRQIREVYLAFSSIGSIAMDRLSDDYSMSRTLSLFLREFHASDIFDNAPTITEISEEFGYSVDMFREIGENFPWTRINTQKIARETAYQFQGGNYLTGNYLNTLSLEAPLDTRNGFINPNWFLYDINAQNAIKLWGSEKTKYIFGRYFRESVNHTSYAHELTLPQFYNFVEFHIKSAGSDDNDEKKLIDVAQHIMEWELPASFTHETLGMLVDSLRHVISDLRSSGGPKVFQHPIQTSASVKRYYGYFSGSKGFENTHLIMLESQDNEKKRTLRFATDMDQDVFLFVMIQVSHFLNSGQLISTNTLWREVYSIYNRLSLEGVEHFDARIFSDQYETLVHKVVWPLSREYREKKGNIGKAHNALLYGVYGTGKSQLLTYLIKEREYTLKNGHTIHLDANIINIGILEFADMLVKSASGFRKRLSDIHENTGRPIVLVIEDIDTIVKEFGTDSDPVSQAMTTLFEGIGSLPVTVVASTNNPEILPQRHLRPNRLDTVIAFPYPLDPHFIASVLEVHWKRKGLNTLLKNILNLENICDELVVRMKYFTPSHISAFCLSLAEDLEFENISELSEGQIREKIDAILTQSLVPIQDMYERENAMKKWRQSLSSSGSTMGFIQ